jgi:hypothetical protein
MAVEESCREAHYRHNATNAVLIQVVPLSGSRGLDSSWILKVDVAERLQSGTQQ